MIDDSEREKLESNLDKVVDPLARYLSARAKMVVKFRNIKNEVADLEDDNIGESEKYEIWRDGLSDVFAPGDNLGSSCARAMEDYWKALMASDGALDEEIVTKWSSTKDSGVGLLTYIKNNWEDAKSLLRHDGKEGFEDEIFKQINFDWMKFRNTHYHWGLNKEWKRPTSPWELSLVNPGYWLIETEKLVDGVEGIYRLVSPVYSNPSNRDRLEKDLDSHAHMSVAAKHDSDRVYARISKLKWGSDEYIEPTSGCVQDLVDKAHRDGRLAIWGKGGIGKTALANKYITLNHDGRMNARVGDERVFIEPFERIVYLTSKTEGQGEFYPRDLANEFELETGHRLDTRSIENAAAYFYGGDFRKFITNVAGLYDDYRFDSDEVAALKILADHHVLVVLDNFEDVQYDKKAEEFYKFFGKLSHGQKSTILLTTRPQKDPDMRILGFPVQGVSDQARYDLIKRRMRWLAKGGANLDQRALDFFLEGADQSVVFGRLLENVPGEFSENLRYPHVLFMFTKLMLDAFAKIRGGTGTGEGAAFEEALKIVLSDDEPPKFTDIIKDHDKWCIEKSITFHKKSEYSMNILKELYKNEGGLTREELANNLDYGIGAVANSIQQMEWDSAILEDSSRWEDPVKLTMTARRGLMDTPEFNQLQVVRKQEELVGIDERDKKAIEGILNNINQQSGVISGSSLDELKGSIRKALNPPGGGSLGRRRVVKESNLIFARVALSELHILVEQDRVSSDNEFEELLREFGKMAFNTTIRLVLEREGGSKPMEHLGEIVAVLDHESATSGV